jgi:hypothetical protein
MERVLARSMSSLEKCSSLLGRYNPNLFEAILHITHRGNRNSRYFIKGGIPNSGALIRVVSNLKK